MTCPCLYPLILIITDNDGDEIKYWSMPDDELDNGKFNIPKIDYVTEDGIPINESEASYVAVKWANTNGANLKKTEVNEHLVYSGCSFNELVKKGGKMKCKEPQLYLVLHPKEEWEDYHIRTIKA